MAFKNGVKNIQTAGYYGAHTTNTPLCQCLLVHIYLYQQSLLSHLFDKLSITRRNFVKCINVLDSTGVRYDPIFGTTSLSEQSRKVSTFVKSQMTQTTVRLTKKEFKEGKNVKLLCFNFFYYSLMYWKQYIIIYTAI